MPAPPTAAASSSVGVLCVCLGNICRSPMAESLLKAKLARQPSLAHVFVESAGTGSWHTGEQPDKRTRAVLAANGITSWSRARQVCADDFARSRYIIAMDFDNLRDLEKMPAARAAGARAHLSLSTAWDGSGGAGVPDPYYGDINGFHAMYAQLDAICEAVVQQLADAHGRMDDE